MSLLIDKTEKRISELQAISWETCSNKKKKKPKGKKKIEENNETKTPEQIIQNLRGSYKRCKIHMVEILEEERQRTSRNIWNNND